MKELESLIDSVAREIAFCNCAEQAGPLRQCEHVAIRNQILRRLLPLLEAGQKLRNELSGVHLLAEARFDYDAALAAARGEK